MIRTATPDDIPAIKRIADANRRELGFVMRPALEESQARGELLVSEVDSTLVGFVNYRTLSRVRVGWRSVYEICVSQDHRGKGIGGALLDAVPRPLRLKCPIDLPSNAFYQAYGLINVWTEQPDDKRPLNIWQSQPDIIYCAGGNRALAKIAIESGMLYGTRHDDTPAFKPHFVDINWKRYDWRDYLSKIAQWKPVMAMVNDYEYPSQRGAMLRRACQLVELGVQRVMVCPKFPGAVAHIPEWCLVAISVPSQYAGFLPDITELTGRRTHLLGGNPQNQMELTRRYRGAGITVSSVDGNAIQRSALMGVIFTNGRWWRPVVKDATAHLEPTFKASARNLMTAWRQHGAAAQLPLF